MTIITLSDEEEAELQESICVQYTQENMKSYCEEILDIHQQCNGWGVYEDIHGENEIDCWTAEGYLSEGLKRFIGFSVK